jgi:hypothetical protein
MTTNPRQFFAIDKSNYVPISREYIRDSHPIKLDLDLNLVLARLDISQIVHPHSTTSIPIQVGRSESLESIH